MAARQQPAAPAPAPTCQEWHECQRLALEAYAQGDYEHFHDLAWRTVQTGPPRNPELMYLLARAQSLSGRPHDALIMLGRLVDMGFVTDAAADKDFDRVRQHPQWPELEAAIARGGPAKVLPPSVSPSPVSLPPVTPPVTSPPVSLPAPSSPTATVAVPHVAEDALRIPGTVLGSAGLAYDRVSSRFVAADAGLRKLVIIDQRSGHLVDLVTSDSAGFYDVTGLEIDQARGNLWVVSAEPPAAAGAEQGPASALHKLQLVSGRPLERLPVPADLQPCRLQDVAVTRDGSVLVLDAIGNRVLRVSAATHSFTPVATLHVQGSTSLAPAGDRIVYVAHASGIARVDTVTGAVASLAGARDMPLGGFERIRWARNSLVGVQRLPDGSRRAARIRIVAARAAAIDIIDAIPAADSAVVTVDDDEFYFVVHPPGDTSGDLVIRRSRIR
jgi:hypothetical protein